VVNGWLGAHTEGSHTSLFNKTVSYGIKKLMRIYLDNCCLNRPFDDQSQVRIRLEAEAKLKTQEEIREGNIDLVWSYVLDYENSKNPFEERRKQIQEWRDLSILIVQANDKIIQISNHLVDDGMQKYDALHIGCAVDAGSDCFLTTDDKLLKGMNAIEGTRIIDPFVFVKEMAL